MYDYRLQLVSVAPGSVGTKLLTGRSSRVSLIVSGNFSATLQLLTIASPTTTSRIVSILAPQALVMPFRDWGPIIQGEIWAITNSAGALDVLVAEVFSLTRCG
jgi:hypothetical protein